jgi:hypothetical protein
MRRISEELRALGQDGIFFDSGQVPMKEARDWGTLIHLLNEDFRDLHERPRIEVESAARWLLDRFDRARREVGAPASMAQLDAEVRGKLQEAIERDARTLLTDKLAEIPASLEGRTIVAEFARGGREGSRLPLPAPYGYQYSLGELSAEILRRASILYVWVTPEESRRKNEARSRPGREGDASILHHGVPERVMREDYGTDDMEHLVQTSDRPDTVRIEAHGQVFHLPVARLDNRQDLTSFLRDDPASWPADKVDAIHGALREAFQTLLKAPR